MPDGRCQKILFCEDDDSVRRVTQRLLERAGFNIVPAHSGADAMSVFDGHEGAFDILITDVVMPGMSGPELAHKMRQTAPDLKVLFISGFAAEHSKYVEGFGSGAAFLPKPYTSSGLVDVIRFLLGR